MRILIENSSYPMHNAGDFAMLDVAIRRIRKIIPSGTCRVITTNPAVVNRAWPTVSPLNRWKGVKVSRYLRRLIRENIASDSRIPQGFQAGMSRSMKRAVEDADLIVLTGGGYLTDVFPAKLVATMGLVQYAVQRGKKIVCFGQGIGPFKDFSLRALTAESLKGVAAIGLREGTYSPRELQAMGIETERYRVTGDDALCVAQRYREQCNEARLIGINLRIANYANTGANILLKLKTVLNKVGAKHSAWAPIPISFSSSTPDLRAIEALGLPLIQPVPATSATEVGQLLQTIALCRACVVGSYHAGVFSLAMGVPIVALSGSDYYRQKFGGLSDLFPGGVNIIDMQDNNWPTALPEAIGATWDLSKELRENLCLAADEQIARSECFYREALSI